MLLLAFICVNSFNMQNVIRFTGRIPDNQVLKILSTADVCLAPDPENGLNEFHTMNKIMDYMKLGKPIVSFDLHESKYSAGDSAVYIKNNNFTKFGDAIMELCRDNKKREIMGKIGFERVCEELTWHHSEKILVELYNNLFNTRK